MEEAKIKMGEKNVIFTKRLIILSMIAIINMRDVYTMHMIPRIVNTNQKIKIMFKKMRRKPLCWERWQRMWCILFLHVYPQGTQWYLVCSNHMIGDDNLSSTVKFGDGKVKNIVGKCVISRQSKKETSKFIYDVYYVPGLTINLLSIGQIL